MTTKNMYYDHPAYLVRSQYQPSQKAAGASTAYDKFVAFTAMQVCSIGATAVQIPYVEYALAPFANISN